MIMKFYASRCLIAATCALVGIMTWSSVATANLLTNPGFEDPPTAPSDEYFGATDWSDFGGGTYTVNSVSNSGDQSLKMFGNPSGVSQEFLANPGELWDGGAWVLNDSGDAMAGGQVAAVNIEWYDAGGDQISFISNGDTISTSPQDEWTLRPISGVAPAGTVKARLTLITGHFGGGGMTGGGGAPKYDDAFFGIRIPEPTTAALAGLGLAAMLGCGLRRKRS
jgi:hypothetical protein